MSGLLSPYTTLCGSRTQKFAEAVFRFCGTCNADMPDYGDPALPLEYCSIQIFDVGRLIGGGVSTGLRIRRIVLEKEGGNISETKDTGRGKRAVCKY
jgi:hypothetical protein